MKVDLRFHLEFSSLKAQKMTTILVMLYLHLKKAGYLCFLGQNLDLEVKVRPLVLKFKICFIFDA